MTAAVQQDSKSSSRRVVLAGALGGLGALVAGAIGRASPARAANGDVITVGNEFTGTGSTKITTSGNAAFYGVSSNSDANAIWGVANAVNGPAWGARGDSYSSAGRGVVGFAAAASGATYGVYGLSQSPSGTGVYATNPTSGLALQAAGRTKLSTSGVATITAGHATKVITPGVNVTSSSFVLLTPKTNIGSRALWYTTDASGNKFTIHMSSSRSSGTKVAWLLLG